jgi:hypothetical protein
MKWYEKQYDIEGTTVCLLGTFIDSEIKISALIKIEPQPDLEFKIVEMFVKPVNMWAHQEILAEDVLAKYIGKIKKCENNLPSLVEREKLNRRI